MDYKKISIILTLLIIIFASLSGYFYYQTYIKTNSKPNIFLNIQKNTDEKILLKQSTSDIKIDEIKNALNESNLSDFKIHTIETNDQTKPIGWYGLENNKVVGYSSYIDYNQNTIKIYLYFEKKQDYSLEELTIYGNMAYINALMNAIEYKKEPGTNYKKPYEISTLLIDKYISMPEKLSLNANNIK